MRKIKFKVWDGNEMMYDPIASGGYLNDAFKKYPLVLKFLQYTGLHDKNGKEIYEGDILKTSNGNFEIIWIEQIAGFGGKALFDVTMFAPKDADADEYAQAIFDGGITSDYKSFEVIGNIYENPELLK